MLPSPRILVVGSINVDLCCSVPRIPAEGETLPGGDLRIGLGGKGANQAVAAARLDAQVALVACVGDDPLASVALKALGQQQVDGAHVRTVPGSTGAALILVDPLGGNRIVISAGANARLTPQDVDGAKPAMARAHLVVVSLEVPLVTVVRTFENARQLGVPVALNPSPALDTIRTYLDQVAYVVPNEVEAGQLTGRGIADPEDALEAARLLRAEGAASAVITLGRGGAVWADEGGQGHFSAVKAEAVDTTGAGDAFMGCLAVALASGLRLPRAVALANRAGALAVSRWGAAASMPSRTEVGF